MTIYINGVPVVEGTDVSDADAVVGEVVEGKFFYAVAPPRKTGTLAEVALAPGSSAYPQGYHVGDGGGLPAIDADLAVGNIKKDVVIFGVTGIVEEGTDISDADAAVGDVRTGKTFYSVEEPRKTGTIAEVAIAAGSENVPAGIHTATTLSAIDGDLAVGNIKSGVTIFGKAGTIAGSYRLQDDQLHNNVATRTAPEDDIWFKIKQITITKLISSPSTLRISFDLRNNSGNYEVNGKIYKNGNPVGFERSNSTQVWETFTQDLSFAQGDTIELWVYGTNSLHLASGRYLKVKGLPYCIAITSTFWTGTDWNL